MNYLEKIDPKLRKRIAHKFDLEYFDIICRDRAWVLNRLVPSREFCYAEKIRRGFNEKDIVIYLPHHRSLCDFLVLGYYFWENGLKIPRFAAGENLFVGRFNDIWRRLGGYAVDRGNRDWEYRKAVVEYVTHLVVGEKCDQVDFIGGGRSYDGRLQKPKLGLLGVVWRASQKIDENVIGQPVYLDYDYVPEEKYFELLKRFKENGNYWAYLSTDIFAYLAQLVWPKPIDLRVEFGNGFSIKECRSKEELGVKVDMALREMACEELRDEIEL